MNKYTPSDSVECYLIVPPQYRPQLFTDVSFLNGSNLKAHVSVVERKNETRTELANGQMDIFPLGKPRKDLTLQITGSNTETELVVEEIINRNIPVYIYPIAGGGLQLNAPLIRGIQTDPLDKATLTLTVKTGTTVYMPRADAGHGIYLEAIDTSAPLLDGVYTANGVEAQIPTGRGMPFFRKHENLIKNSLMSAITYSAPYAAGSEWGAYTSAADVWGTDHGSRDSVRCADAKTYWTKSTTTTLRSFSLNTSGGTQIHLSFMYRVNGSMSIELKDSGGTVRWSRAISTGSGRAQLSTTGIASYAGAYFEVTLASGSFCEIECMQFIDGNTIDVVEWQPFLGTSTAVQGEVTGNDLTIDLDMGADSVAYTAVPADRDGAILASGYFQPQMSEDYQTTGSVFCSMIGYDATFSGYIGAGGGSTFIFGLQTDTTSRDTAAITGHVIGDVYAWGLWSGYSDGVAATRLYCVRARDKATYTCDYATAIMFPYRVVIGADENKAFQADGIVSGVTVQALDWTPCLNAIDRLVDASNLNIFRTTAGRWYTLDRAISPKRYSASSNAGTLTATEVRAI